MSTPITEYGPTLEGDDFMTHLYKIASETSSVDDDLWVLVGDTVILVSQPETRMTHGTRH